MERSSLEASLTYRAPERFQVAAVQVSPIFLDRDATVDRACGLMAEAARRGVKLAVFPEAFLPGYPLWVWAIASGQSQALRTLYAELLDQAVTLKDAAVDRLRGAAREAGLYVAIGVNERNADSSGTSLFNSLLFIGPDGALLGVHRKLIPTAGERLVHAQGDGTTLRAYDTSLGRLGGLICWENYMPLARQALYVAGTQIYVAPTWDRGEPWISTIRTIAKEGRASVIGCGTAMRKDDLPDRFPFKVDVPTSPTGWINPGDSLIADPDGKVLAGPMHEEQGLLVAEVDLQRTTGSRWQLDVAGHYSRPDVLGLVVKGQPVPPLRAD